MNYKENKSRNASAYTRIRENFCVMCVNSEKPVFYKISIPHNIRTVIRFRANVRFSKEIVSMREKHLEHKLVTAVKAAGGIAPKFTSPGTDGMPDRILLFPGGKLAFVEVKRHGQKPTPLQKARHGMLRRLGFLVYVLDDAGQIYTILKEVMPGAIQST